MADNRSCILFVHGADEWYGSDYVLYELVRSLAGTEFDALVLVPDDVNSELRPEQRLSGRLRALGVQVHAIPLTVLRRRYMTPWGIAKLGIGGPSAVRAALRIASGRGVTLVHSHTATVLTGAAVARAIGVPHLWHVSEILERPLLVRKALARKVVGSAESVVAVSRAVRDHLLETEPGAASKIHVIHNGIDPARFADDGARADSAPPGDARVTVGMLGRVGTWKGQELLLSAARIVLPELPETRFVLAGGVLDGNVGALNALRTRARAYGISDRVTITEYCDDVPSFMRGIDIFVLPSLRPDPLPTTVLEAMGSAKPVVAVAHGGAAEMVVDGVTGLLTPPGDADALARAIARLVRDAGMRWRMGTAARERVKRDFSPEAFSEAYLRSYRELVALRRPAAF